MVVVAVTVVVDPFYISSEVILSNDVFGRTATRLFDAERMVASHWTIDEYDYNTGRHALSCIILLSSPERPPIIIFIVHCP